jgi:hypothetical protein
MFICVYCHSFFFVVDVRWDMKDSLIWLSDLIARLGFSHITRDPFHHSIASESNFLEKMERNDEILKSFCAVHNCQNLGKMIKILNFSDLLNLDSGVNLN